MGYSCTCIARLTEEKLIRLLQYRSGKEIESSNSWIHNGLDHFSETGREQEDGAITGKVMSQISTGSELYRTKGTYRIEPCGKVTRFPSASKKEMQTAWMLAIAEFEKTYALHSPYGNSNLAGYISLYNAAYPKQKIGEKAGV